MKLSFSGYDTKSFKMKRFSSLVNSKKGRIWHVANMRKKSVVYVNYIINYTKEGLYVYLSHPFALCAYENHNNLS